MRRIDVALGASLAVFLAGIARDLQWHATHDTQSEFETASKQVEEHAILWIGALGMLMVCALALRRTDSAPTTGYRIALISSMAYAGISIWHFIEHANGNDPQLAHAFLYASSLAMVAGASIALRHAITGGLPASPEL